MQEQLSPRVEALLAELAWQRNAANDRCAAMAGEIATLRAQNAILTAEAAELRAKVGATDARDGAEARP